MSLLCIRSKDRHTGGSSSFTIKLNQHIEGVYELQHCLIPNAQYTVDSTCSSMRVQVGATTHTLTMPVGYYSAGTLMAAVQLQLQTAAAGFTCTYSVLTGKVTIEMASAFALRWANLDNSLASILGFDKADTPTATQATGSNLLDLSAKNLTFNILIDCPGVDYGVTNTDGHHASFVVPCNEDSGQYVSYDVRNRWSQRVKFRSPVRELNVSLRDADFNPVSLQGGEWHMIWAS